MQEIRIGQQVPIIAESCEAMKRRVHKIIVQEGVPQGHP